MFEYGFSLPSPVPDETSILNSRHLLENQHFGTRLYALAALANMPLPQDPYYSIALIIHETYS